MGKHGGKPKAMIEHISRAIFYGILLTVAALIVIGAANSHGG